MHDDTPGRMPPLKLSHFALVSALGHTSSETTAALKSGNGGLRACDLRDVDLDTWIGRVPGVEQAPLAPAFEPFECRNNRLARLGLEADGFAQAVERVRDKLGANRIGVFLGTSTSGIAETEAAYAKREADDGALPCDFRYRQTHNTFSVVDFTRRYLGLSGPALAVSTACSSSLKVLSSARRHIAAGLCDAAVIGGVDTLCLTTLYGFNSLELLSPRPCRPWDPQRNGVSIGEAAGFALLEQGSPEPGDLMLAGMGESVDAHHMSAPHPEGLGARLAMQAALASAGLVPGDIDYVSLHGTATPANDSTEDMAVVDVFGAHTPCSSTKGFTGHTLGAAGIASLLIGCIGMRNGFVPGTINTGSIDAELRANVQTANLEAELRFMMTNAFGFGGNNACAVVEHVV